MSQQSELSPLFRLSLTKGEESSVLLHIRRGAPINGTDSRGRTPLMIAALLGKDEICELLLSEGADIKLRDSAGKTASDLARNAGFSSTADLIETDLHSSDLEPPDHALDDFGSFDSGWETEEEFAAEGVARSPDDEVLAFQEAISEYRSTSPADEWSTANIELPSAIRLNSSAITASLKQLVSEAIANGYIGPKRLKLSWPAANSAELRLLVRTLREYGVRVVPDRILAGLLMGTESSIAASHGGIADEVLDSVDGQLDRFGLPLEARYLNEIERFSGFDPRLERTIFKQLSDARNVVFDTLNMCPRLKKSLEPEITVSKEILADLESEDTDFDSDDTTYDVEDEEDELPYVALFNALQSINPEDRNADEKFVEQALDRFIRARNRAVEGALKLVPTIARKYLNKGIAFEDLIQEGNIGVMRAAEKFDPDQQNRFVTYASFWVMQKMSRVVADQSATIRLPVHLQPDRRRLRNLQLVYLATKNREADLIEIARELEWPIKKASRVFNTPSVACSYVSKKIIDKSIDRPDLNHDNYSIRRAICMILLQLPPRTERILRMRFGFGPLNEHTLEEIGEKFDVTRERVRQIEAKGLRFLRHSSRQRALKELHDN